jgi:hypothetical protein
MGLFVKSFIAGLMGAAAVSAQCTGPAVNSATVSLVAEFEGFSPDICKWLPAPTSIKKKERS